MIIHYMQDRDRALPLSPIPRKNWEIDAYPVNEIAEYVQDVSQGDIDVLVEEYYNKYDILSDGDITVRSLHSFDIWMPIIFIAQSVLLPFAINMVSNYIWEKMKGRETENAEVDMTFIVKNGKKEKSIHYKGDAKTFKESFEKIDLNKMWEE